MDEKDLPIPLESLKHLLDDATMFTFDADQHHLLPRVYQTGGKVKALSVYCTEKDSSIY